MIAIICRISLVIFILCFYIKIYIVRRVVIIDDISKVKNNTERLRCFLAENFLKLETEGGFGFNLSFPNFDLFARDYLLFAEHEILQLKNNLTNIEHVYLINCVSHLRRAIDFQLDICLDVLKIKVFKKKIYS